MWLTPNQSMILRTDWIIFGQKLDLDITRGQWPINYFFYCNLLSCPLNNNNNNNLDHELARKFSLSSVAFSFSGACAFFDVRVFHPNAPSYRQSLPLVFGTTGGMGTEGSCEFFLPIGFLTRVRCKKKKCITAVCIIPRNGTERNGIFRGIILRNGTL